jgi:hypothetical protein
VHGAALALAYARPAAEELRHHAAHVDALGDAVTVAAVRGADEVAVAQVGADSRCHRLLPGVEMEEAAELSGRHEVVQLLLEGADPAQLPVDVEQLLAR